VVPKLDLILPQSELEEGKSDAILKVVPGDDKRHQVVYRQVGGFWCNQSDSRLLKH
jgi:hypothetical protein